MTVEDVHARLEREGVQVSRSSVGNIIKAWNGQPEELRWREMPFEWRRLERARVPWEASRWVMDCQREHGVRDWRARKRIADQGGIPIFDAIWLHSFTNRWACWSWRVHLAAPHLQPFFVLLVARIYVAIEQLEDLGEDAPATEFEWLDSVLMHGGDFQGMELNPAFPTDEQIREAYFRFLKLGGTFQAVGPYEALKWVYYWMYSWWQEARHDAEVNGNAHGQREHQTAGSVSQ